MPETSPIVPGSLKAAARRPAKDVSKFMTLFVMVVVTLYFGRQVLIPITLALLLAFLLAPLVSLFRRWHLGRIPSVLLVVTVTTGILLGVGSLIGSQIGSLAGSLPKYTTTIETKFAAVKAETVGRLTKIMRLTGDQTKSPRAASQPSQTTSAAPQSESTPAPPAQPAQQSASSPWEMAKEFLGPILSPIATIGIVFIVAIFALLQSEDLRDRLIRLLGSDDIHHTTIAMDDADARLRRYFLTQLAINTAFGVIIGAGLYFIGVPNPLLWGVLSALLRFIPYVGSVVSAVLPIALAAAVEPGWSMALWTTALYVVVEAVTSQAIEPMMYGHSTGVSPFAVVVAAIFWSWVWGPVGLFLSTPLTLCLVVIGRNVQRLEFLDVILGDRPALTPIESFYQRILADDSDKIMEQAESLLKEISLAEYYDDVALKGMQLAANDADRGVLTVDQLEAVKRTIYELVDDLAEYVEKQISNADAGNLVAAEVDSPGEPADTAGISIQPENMRIAPAILSIAGRGPLDEPASTMLVHLLQEQGIGGRTVKYNDVSRHALQNLDVSNVVMVSIAYLDISGNPAHLRYLIRRLRRYLPAGTPILVGLWPKQDPALKNEETRKAIGADYYASSFAEVIHNCVAFVQKDNEEAESRSYHPAVPVQ